MQNGVRLGQSGPWLGNTFKMRGKSFLDMGKKYNSFCPVSMLSTLWPTAFEFVFALEIGFNSVCESVSGV